ncbi:MAG: hypothetical protein WD059_01030 [Balneolaceae bacterium]
MKLYIIAVTIGILLSGCVSEKKMDKEARKAHITDAVDSVVIGENSLTNSGKSLTVKKYNCRYFAGTMIKCSFDVNNPGSGELKNLDVWYTVSGKEMAAVTTGDTTIQPGESGTLETIMVRLPKDAQSVQFTIKSGIKKHRTNIKPLPINEIAGK